MDMIWNLGTSYDQGPPKNLYSIREFWLDLPSYLKDAQLSSDMGSLYKNLKRLIWLHPLN